MAFDSSRMYGDENVIMTPTSPFTDSSNFTFFNESFVSDFDADNFLLKSLGPKRLNLNWLIPLTVVYSIIFLTGIVGNICTCLVIARNQYMQTATNCYLFNLAIADMMTLLFVEDPDKYWFQKVSRIPASTSDLLHLQDRMDNELLRQEAREIGLCDVRRKLYDQLFDELTRQEIVVCPERGRLLRMIRRETELSMTSLLSCYESGLAYGVKKKLSSSTETAQLTSQITQILSNVAKLNDVIQDLTPKVAEVKKTTGAREREKEEEFFVAEEKIREENEALLAQLKECIQVAIEEDEDV